MYDTINRAGRVYIVKRGIFADEGFLILHHLINETNVGSVMRGGGLLSASQTVFLERHYRSKCVTAIFVSTAICFI